MPALVSLCMIVKDEDENVAYLMRYVALDDGGPGRTNAVVRFRDRQFDLGSLPTNSR
jgi:hypothetical protein